MRDFSTVVVAAILMVKRTERGVAIPVFQNAALGIAISPRDILL